MLANTQIPMKRSMKYENQPIETIRRTQPIKRHSDNFCVEQLAIQRAKQQNTSENCENTNFNQMPPVIKYVPTRREVDSLVIDNYLFQRVSATCNKDGSIGWRCKEYRRNTKCQSTCRVGVNGEMIRQPGKHNHPCVSDAALVFMKAKADAKKRCRSENNIPIQKIFLQEMGKAIINSGISLTPEDLSILPKFESNKRCLQIQRKNGRMSMSGDDTMSIASSDEQSVKSDQINDNYTRSPPGSIKCEQIDNEVPSPPESVKSGHIGNEVRSPPVSVKFEPINNEAPSPPESVKSEHSTKMVSNKPIIKGKKKGLNNIISGLWQTRVN